MNQFDSIENGLLIIVAGCLVVLILRDMIHRRMENARFRRMKEAAKSKKADAGND